MIIDEEEKDIVRAVAKALPEMDERSKGYFLGYAEAMATRKNLHVPTENIKSQEKLKRETNKDKSTQE